jgi:transposase-like protein
MGAYEANPLSALLIYRYELSHKNSAFLRQVKERGLKDVRLFVSGQVFGLVERLGKIYPTLQRK